MPTLNDLVGNDKFWDFPADRRAVMAKQANPEISKFADDRIDVILQKMRDARPASEAPARSPAEQATQRIRLPVEASVDIDPKTGEPSTKYAVTRSGRSAIATTAQIAAATSAIIPGSALVRGVIGAAGEAAVEAGEMYSGEREGINPLAIGTAGVSAAVLPGVSGKPLYDALKGGIYGIGSYTLNNWARGRDALESPGMAAISTISAAFMHGMSPKLFRGATNELLPRKEAELATEILDGKVPAALKASSLDHEVAKETVEEVKAIKSSLARDKKGRYVKRGGVVQTRVVDGVEVAPAGVFHSPETFKDTPSGTIKQLLEDSVEIEAERKVRGTQPRPKVKGEKSAGWRKDKVPVPQGDTDAGEELTATALAKSVPPTSLPPNDINMGGGPGGGGKPPKFEYEGEDLPAGMRLTSGINRTKDWMAGVESRTDLPTFEHYTNVRKGLYNATRDLGRDTEQLHSIYKGVKGSRRISYQLMLESDPANRHKLVQMFNLGPDDIKRVERIESFLKDRFEGWGLDSKKFFQEVMPRVRSHGSLEAAYPTGIMPKEAKFFSRSFRSEMIGPEDKDSLGFISRIMKIGTTREHVEPAIKVAKKFFSNTSIPSSIRAGMNTYLNTVRGTEKDITRTLSEVIHKYFNKVPGVDFSRRDARYFVDTLIGLQYTSTLGFRSGTLIRNAFQGLQTAYPTMGKWYFHGLRRAFTREGKQFAEKMGATVGDPQYLETLRRTEGASGRGTMQTISRGLNRVQGWSLKPYGGMDDLQLKAVYLGKYDHVMSVVRKTKNIDQIMHKADLDTFTVPEQKRWRGMLEAGRFHDVADEAGKALGFDTQWSNLFAGDKAPILRGGGGRTLGGFTNWPLMYGAYLKRNFFGPQPMAKKLRFFGRWTAANGMLASMTYAGASSLGYEHPFRSAMSNTFINPGITTGGPYFNLAVSSAEAMNEASSAGTYDFDKGKFGPKFTKWANEMNATFALQGGEFVQRDLPEWWAMMNDQDPSHLIKLMGFAPRSIGEHKK